jgi:hypothetical protein
MANGRADGYVKDLTILEARDHFEVPPPVPQH